MSKWISNTISYVILVIAAVLTLAPIGWAALTSFKERTDILVLKPLLVFQPTLRNYIILFANEPPYYLWHVRVANSLFVCLITVAVCLLMSSLAAYSFSRFDFWGSKSLPPFILSFRMIPPVCFLLPWYLIFLDLHLLDNPLSLILVYSIFTIPFDTWMLRGFFLAIPRDLDEAALTEGYSRLEILFKIVFPLAKSGIMITTIFSFIFIFYEFMYAVVLTKLNWMTAPVALSRFLSAYATEWGPMMAATMTITIPLVIIMIVLRKHVITGLTLGAVK